MTALTESINQIVSLSEDEITAIEKAYNTVEISKGELFIEQGKICDQVAFVVSGKLRNFYFDEAGNEVTCYFVTLNNFVSAFSSFLTNAQTNEPVKPNRWGAEISPVGLAAFSITQAKATYLINPEKMCRTEV